MTRRNPYRVVIHGVDHFCRKLATLALDGDWDVRHCVGRSWGDSIAAVRDLRGCDLIYHWGGVIQMSKFLRLARWMGADKMIMLWAGSDALAADVQFAPGKVDPWIAKQVHWAVSPWLAEEVRWLGLPCEYVQASFVPPVADPAPLPEKLTVAVYLPNTDPKTLWLYGWDDIVKVASLRPAVRFTVLGPRSGNLPEAPSNVCSIGWTSDVCSILRHVTALWRPLRHDGLSFMVLEALSHGRHVIYSYPLPGCVQANNAGSVVLEIDRLMELQAAGTLELNKAGMNYVHANYDPQIVRADLRNRWQAVIDRRDVSVVATHPPAGAKGATLRSPVL